MPTASPFDMMLQQAQQRAAKDPAGVFADLDKLYGKTLTSANVLAIGAFAAHLGGAALGKWDATIAFLERCLTHDAVEERSDTWCSLKRALAVQYRCAGNQEAATDAIAAGVRNPSEHCRVTGLTAQALIARNRPNEAAKALEESIALLEQLPNGDEASLQLAAIAQGLHRPAEHRAQANLQVQLLSSQIIAEVTQRQAQQQPAAWREAHKGHFIRGRALLAVNRPIEALAEVQAMMAIEGEHPDEVGPVEQCHSAGLACFGQLAKGNLKIAKQALAACEALAEQIDQEQAKQSAMQVAKECAAAWQLASEGLESSQ